MSPVEPRLDGPREALNAALQGEIYAYSENTSQRTQPIIFPERCGFPLMALRPSQKISLLRNDSPRQAVEGQCCWGGAERGGGQAMTFRRRASCAKPAVGGVVAA